ncbi:NADPH-dependent glutamate synthase [Treponema pallidum]|uniref:NADPH-dependent glutamate synthase n=1 Tax=Treponema pallidum TaxID=160 RepID=UPI00244EC2CC|nr:NADPH-dependent glutamate synthase [Treponema pallidum]WGK71217.1 glutamate synthase (NADPH) homotetrameric [Treponema pallidum subsp. pertenue]
MTSVQNVVSDAKTCDVPVESEPEARTYRPHALLQEEACQRLAQLQGKELKMKDRTQIPLQRMRMLPPKKRSLLMQEAALGFTEQQALVESQRCLNCKTKPCVKGCPVGVPIPEFIACVQRGAFKEAVDIIKTTSLLPAICGRVCPHERQCQFQCTVGKMFKDVSKAVSIGALERFVADWERQHGQITVPYCAPSTHKKVAVIGSGPAGLAVASDTARAGHSVTVFEALHKPGGVVTYGIPEFRLPKEVVVTEIETLKKMGVTFRMDFLVGRTATLEQLFSQYGFDAVFIGTGAGLPRFMNIEGEELCGVFAANDYLTRATLMKAYDTAHADTPVYAAKSVVVVGGGNVAVDSSRTALRLGAEQVHCLYRKTRADMTACVEEIAQAEDEGVTFHFLCQTTRILGDEEGNVRAVVFRDCQEQIDAGERVFLPCGDAECELAADAVIVAVGNGSNPLMAKTTRSLAVSERGTIVVDEDQRTSIPGVWAGGDIVLGAATVIRAMGQGRRAAASINAYLAQKA